MSDIATQIKHLAELAEAPRREFRPWKGVAIVDPSGGFSLGTPVQVISYKVPRGKNLILTNVELAVSTRNPTPPMALAAVEPLLVFSSLFGYWAINDRPVTTNKIHYTALAGPQLRVFPGAQNARCYIESGVNTGASTIGFYFRFDGFLTLAEYGQRLKQLETEIPNVQQLGSP